MSSVVKAILLLIGSNIFMTFAWYGHLRYRDRALGWVILASWGIAFFEYCLQVPANRMGSEVLRGAQLKILQEGITFAVFAVFSWAYLHQPMTRYDAAAFGMVMVGVAISLFQP